MTMCPMLRPSLLSLHEAPVIQPVPEHERVVLAVDLPALGLRAGDIGCVVHVHPGGAGYEVEFCTLTGETIAVASVIASQVRPVTAQEMPSARRLVG